MASDKFFVYIQLPEYLLQWFCHNAKMEDGAVVPAKNSMFSKVLENSLKRQPMVFDSEQYVGNLKIRLPEYRYKRPEFYNYLAKIGKQALIDEIYNEFDIELWDAIRILGKINRYRKSAVMAWMDAEGIECSDKNYNAVIKHYNRLREQMRKNKKK